MTKTVSPADFDSSRTNMLVSALDHGQKQIGLDLTAEQQSQLLRYLELLHKWNRVYNLTAVRDPEEMLQHHVLDSLAVVPALRRQLQQMVVTAPVAVLDVGAGAGLPGLALAVAMPELSVTCVDAVGKKVAFVQQAAVALGLHNLQACHARVETLTTHAWSIVCSRAFASLSDFTRWTEQALARDGVWMAMKGREPAGEMAALSPAIEVFHVEQLQVPGLQDAQRCLVWLRRRETEVR